MIEVVAALIWDQDKFMICQRPAHKARGLLWEFVGGKVEPGETKEAALIRECREELCKDHGGDGNGGSHEKLFGSGASFFSEAAHGQQGNEHDVTEDHKLEKSGDVGGLRLECGDRKQKSRYGKKYRNERVTHGCGEIVTHFFLINSEHYKRLSFL